MRELKAEKFESFDTEKDFSRLDLHAIECNDWDYPADVKACFGIGFNSDNIFFRSSVQESNISATYRACNVPVHEDSCVEFFISLEPEYYYNFEFNCIGRVHGAYVPNRENRRFLEKELLETIKIIPSLGSNKIYVEDRETAWTLDIVIPVHVFKFSKRGLFSKRMPNTISINAAKGWQCHLTFPGMQSCPRSLIFKDPNILDCSNLHDQKT